MLVHLAEVVLQDLQLLLSGNHWLFHGHLLLGQGYGARHCREGPVSLLKLGVASGATFAEPQICHPCPHRPPPPAVASGCSRAQLPSQRHARELSWERQPPSYCCLSLLSAASTRQQCPALSCLTILSWQEAAGCSALPWCCIYSQSDSHGNDSCLQPYLGLGVT